MRNKWKFLRGSNLSFSLGCIIIVRILMLTAVGLCLKASASENSLNFPVQMTTALASGPLKVEAATKKCKISRQHALEIAYLSVTGGSPASDADAWQASFSDSEFVGNPIAGISCWIVMIPGLTLDGFDNRQDLFAIVEGTSGCFVEAFTLPTSEWWKATDKMGSHLQNLYRMGEQMGLISMITPPISLKRTFSALAFMKADFGLSKQFVARFLLYTDTTNSFNISRVDRYLNVPIQTNNPTWYICFQGLNKPFSGPLPPGVDASGIPRVQEDYVQFDINLNKVTEYGSTR